MVTVPDIKLVQHKLPEVSNLEYHKPGGFKIVYWGEIEGQKEAVKLVQIPEDPHDPEVKKENLGRINREITLLDQCKSTNLVNIGSLDVREIEINSITYLVYSEEFIDGEDLQNLIKKNYHPTRNELYELARCLLNCIEELSSKGAVHRDIKPANILKTDNERGFVLIDLGLAFLMDGTDLTRNPRAVPGTDAYLAPEMFEDSFRKRLDYRADLYNMGLTIYEYATNSHPFRSKYNRHSTFYNIRSKNAEAGLGNRPAGRLKIWDRSKLNAAVSVH